MWSYILRRLFFGIPTLLGVTIIVFTLLYLAPGDPISAMVPSDAPLEVVQMIKQQMGFDKPLPVQYWRWLTRVAHGDLGHSLATRRPVLNEIRAALGKVLSQSSIFGQNPKIGCQEFNDLQTPKLSK